MASEASIAPFQLSACRELLDEHPESLRIREQVEALEGAMPDRPGVVVSFCRTIIETTCKTILTDRSVGVDAAWEAPKLVSEAMKYLNLGPSEDGSVDAKLRSGAESLVRGLNQIIMGVVEIRNAHGSAAHGADAYEPLLDSRYAEILARAQRAGFKMVQRGVHHYPRTAGTQTGGNIKVILRAFVEIVRLRRQIVKSG